MCLLLVLRRMFSAVLYFGFFLVFPVSDHIFIPFSGWFFWSLPPLLQPPWNRQVGSWFLLAFGCWFFPLPLFGEDWLGSLLQNNNKIINTTFFAREK